MVIVLVAIAAPRSRGGPVTAPPSPAARWPACSARSATVRFLFATREGYLSIASVVTSLYPAFTVLLAATVLREHVHRAQAMRPGCCARWP